MLWNVRRMDACAADLRRRNFWASSVPVRGLARRTRGSYTASIARVHGLLARSEREIGRDRTSPSRSTWSPWYGRRSGRSIGGSRHLEADRRGSRRPLNGLRGSVLHGALEAPLGHPGCSVGCPRQHRPLGACRARLNPHENLLLCSRRQRQLFCSRGPPAAEGIEARGGGGGGDRHGKIEPRRVSHALLPPRQAGSASAGRLCRRAVLSLPTVRCWLAPAPAPEGPTSPCCSASLLIALDRGAREAPHLLPRCSPDMV